MTTTRFPVVGPRQAVYNFLQSKGFQMSSRSDKEWTRGEFTTLVIYGAGSMANIYSQKKNYKAMPLEEAVNAYLKDLKA